MTHWTWRTQGSAFRRLSTEAFGWSFAEALTAAIRCTQAGSKGSPNICPDGGAGLPASHKDAGAAGDSGAGSAPDADAGARPDANVKADAGPTPRVDAGQIRDAGTSDTDAGGDGCTGACGTPACGSAIKEPSEQCDDGNVVSGDGCSSTCQYERCGDAIVNDGEQCDDGAESATCNLDCTLRACGDGKVNHTAGEQCDDGAQNRDNGDCTAGCKINVCGDGHIDVYGPLRMELCDDGNAVNSDGCRNDCVVATCGDGVLESGEQCDDGNVTTSDACVNCSDARCGDGVVRSGVEQCDDGNLSNSDGCLNTCELAVCGDGFINSGVETCDDGNTVTETCAYGVASCMVCDATCQAKTAYPSSACGDGVVDPTYEVCDDGNSSSCGSCGATCRTVTSVAATGYIAAVAAANLNDGATGTLDDGYHASTVLEFDSNASISAGNVRVAFTPGQPASTVANAIATAIGGSGLFIGASVSGALVVLTHQLPTSLGNQALMETVSDASFTVIGMSGGRGADCTAGTGCVSNGDCASFSCNHAIATDRYDRRGQGSPTARGPSLAHGTFLERTFECHPVEEARCARSAACV